MPHLKDVLVIAVAEGDVFELHVVAVRCQAEVNRTCPILSIRSGRCQLARSCNLRDRQKNKQM